MPKALLAVVTCHGHGGFAEAVRSTWMPLVPEYRADIKLFFGRGGKRKPLNDEVFLDCGDGYFNLPEKVKEILRYARNNGYEFVFKIDDDTIVKPKEFFSYPFEQWDYVGGGAVSDGSLGVQRTPWGFCYMLSKKSMDIVLGSDLPVGEHKSNDEHWVSNVLHNNGVYLHVDSHYHFRTGEANPASAYKERPLPEGVSVICVHIHQEHSRPETESIKEFYRLAEEHLTHGQDQ